MSSIDKEVKNYLPDNHEVFYKPASTQHKRVLQELNLPPESVRLISFKNLNETIGGFRPNEFSILCGATGTGKTTLCANLSMDLIDQKIPHFVASVETGHLDYLKRIYSAKVMKDLNHGDAINIEEIKKINLKTKDWIKESNLFVSLYDNRFSVETLMADITYMIKNYKIKIAIIDNLNFFLEVTSAKESVVVMDKVIHELIIFCKKTPVHIIMVMHPKKTINGRVESEFDIKGSSTSVQEAHNVFLFNRCLEEKIEKGFCERDDRELKIAKVRRRGKYVGSRIIFKSIEGVSYQERELWI